jgi:hypothetical protein
MVFFRSRAELVRYETEGRHVRYRLKHPREVKKILDALSGLVKAVSPTDRQAHLFMFSQLRKHESVSVGR